MTDTILRPLAIMRGPTEKGIQFYQAMGEDAKGDMFVLRYGCLMCYVDAVEKAFSRLKPVDLDPVEEGVKIDTQNPTPAEDTPNA